MYITFDKDIISLFKFKDLQTQCILALAEKYQDFYFELLPDIEFDGIEEDLPNSESSVASVASPSESGADSL